MNENKIDPENLNVLSFSFRNSGDLAAGTTDEFSFRIYIRERIGSYRRNATRRVSHVVEWNILMKTE